MLELGCGDGGNLVPMAVALPGAASAVELYGPATLATASDGGVVISAEGPVFTAWALPGVVAP